MRTDEDKLMHAFMAGFKAAIARGGIRYTESELKTLVQHAWKEYCGVNT